MDSSQKYQYGYWKTDKPKEEGFSHELISSDTQYILDRTDLDSLYALPYTGIDTLHKCLERHVLLNPDKPFLGSRDGDKYVWKTHVEVSEIRKALSVGIMAFDLAPEIEAEGKKWRFLGIQSKNREEWNLTNWGNMYQGITTVALYDTLGQDAMKFVCNQTEMTTIFASAQYVGSIAKLKLEDSND